MICRPRMGAWIEIILAGGTGNCTMVAPAWGRGLKCSQPIIYGLDKEVAPAWGRGLKFR